MADENGKENEDKNTPEPGSEEYEKQMAEKHDKGLGDPSDDTQDDLGVPEMPEGGYEKFYNSETGSYDWQSHAKELEYKLEQKGEGEEKDDKSGEGDDKSGEGDDKDKSDEEKVNDIVTDAGLDTQELARKIREEGDISDEDKEALKKQGIPEDLIEDYVDLAKYRVDKATEEAVSYVGGEDAWEDLNAWATENLSDSEKKTYNQMLASEDWKTAVDILKQKKADAAPGGREGNLREGSDGARAGTASYNSREEMMKDMQSPEYKNDPAFRAKVHQRVAVSDFTMDYTG